uniref:Endonuclease/exonuclease/phosphatase domain-containing protein n=1 Tax=Amphimedon queenslandica TaxID=400682 RepID=A0A1X7SGX5_AMPQE
MSQVLSLIHSSKIDLFACTESWLTPLVFNKEFIPPDYLVFRYDRDSRGGGVFLAVRDNIPCSFVPPGHDSILEQVTVTITLPHPVTICVMYRPPNASSDYDTSVINYINYLFSTMGQVILLGDFNAPDIDWATLTGSSPFSNVICDLIFHNNLDQLVNSPTHIKGNLLDLIITNDCSLIEHVNVSSSPSFSDHFIVFFQVISSSPRPVRPSHSSGYNYSKADWDGLIDHLLDYDFSPCFAESDIESIWSSFKGVLLSSMCQFIPKFTRSSRSCPWLRGPLPGAYLGIGEGGC